MKGYGLLVGPCHLRLPAASKPCCTAAQAFEYVLDYLRARRFADPAPSALPREERALELLAR